MAGDARILVIGGDGEIGAAVASRLEASGRSVIRTSRRGSAGSIPLDLAAIPADWRPPEGVSAAILCAAVTSTGVCRDQPEEARRVNVDATVELGRRLTAAGARIVFLSTNLVFDGSVPFTPAVTPYHPQTAYGRMKAAAEQGLLALGRTTVVRLTKVVGRTLPVIERWRHDLLRGEPIHPVADLRIAPVSIDLAAMVIAAGASRPLGDVIQVSPRSELTYAEVAVRLAARWRADTDLVQPVTAAELSLRLEHLPAHVTLDTATLRDRLGIEPPDPWAAFDEVA